MQVKFRTLVKRVTSKALASNDKGYEVLLQTEDENVKELINAPGDAEVICEVNWIETLGGE